ncbi:TetR/AcrR family transcriptional regulator [Bacillus sp. WMMC1349]|uniref:TetR/AcrR family transcriptional regulator n=1 Tax=Bacillus sp. WMMC1349 TaxID=2736254 RepID=UPI001552F616|nr:TetR/AcrR family transcriptional regulator [Bacillus sp. WMMC1349]NPC94696.1 TetR/AcrR family transcriptional regulator [Bacillus sp. WMMC1349]
MTWRRARSKEQIEFRKKEILDAAYQLFEKKEYESISLNSIARELQISKPSIYRYFSSREEIFLDIYSHVFELFYENLIEEFSTFSMNPMPEHVGNCWVKVYLNHEKLLNLMPLLGIALEKNSSESFLRTFKEKNIQLQQNIAGKIVELYPKLTIQAGFYIQYYAFLLASSHWSLTNTDQVMENILSEYRYMNINYSFEYVVSRGIEAHIKGFIGNQT